MMTNILNIYVGAAVFFQGLFIILLHILTYLGKGEFHTVFGAPLSQKSSVIASLTPCYYVFPIVSLILWIIAKRRKSDRLLIHTLSLILFSTFAILIIHFIGLADAIVVIDQAIGP